MFFFFFQAEDGIRDLYVTGVQTCALPISALAISATAFAEPPRWAPAHGYRGDHYAAHYVVRPAYRHYYYQPYYYRPAPRVVVVQRPLPVYPAYPAYPASVDVNTGLAIFAGAVIGGVIAHELVR